MRRISELKQSVKDKHGNVLKEGDQIINRWKQYENVIITH